jgi:hypothetical protein
MFLFPLFSPESFPKLVLCAFEDLNLIGRKIPAASIDVKSKHRHCRLKPFHFSAMILSCRSLERQPDLLRTFQLEDLGFEIHGITGRHNALRPAIHGLPDGVRRLAGNSLTRCGFCGIFERTPSFAFDFLASAFFVDGFPVRFVAITP